MDVNWHCCLEEIIRVQRMPLDGCTDEDMIDLGKYKQLAHDHTMKMSYYWVGFKHAQNIWILNKLFLVWIYV